MVLRACGTAQGGMLKLVCARSCARRITQREVSAHAVVAYCCVGYLSFVFMRVAHGDPRAVAEQRRGRDAFLRGAPLTFGERPLMPVAAQSNGINQTHLQ